MNTKEKLQELKRRKQEITDEIARLETVEGGGPERGDIFRHEDYSSLYIITDLDQIVWLTDSVGIDPPITPIGNQSTFRDHDQFLDFVSKDTYLGKFSDVFVLKKAVAKALSIEDCDGDSALYGDSTPYTITLEESRQALKKLGITKELLPLT